LSSVNDLSLIKVFVALERAAAAAAAFSALLAALMAPDKY
jgi:hypothetical protein